MKYLTLISQLAAILFLILDLFEFVNYPVLRVAAYGVITLSFVMTIFWALYKSKTTV
jgi:hypothetical protein